MFIVLISFLGVSGQENLKISGDIPDDGSPSKNVKEGKATNTWTGSTNHYWHNNGNWSLGHIPTSTEDVVVANAGYQPVKVDYYNEECNSLLISADADLQLFDQVLVVNGNLDIYGEIEFLYLGWKLIVQGDVFWHAGSSYNSTAAGSFRPYGNWNFLNGADIDLDNVGIRFLGNGTSWVRIYSSTCSFYNLSNQKSGGGKVVFSNLSTYDLIINKLCYLYPDAIFESYSYKNIVFKDDFHYEGTADFTKNSNTGSVVFDGDAQTIDDYGSGTALFNNVILSPATSVKILGNNLTIASNLTINSGTFIQNGKPVYVGGNWTNNVGTNGFTESGRVVFNGSSGHQYCSDETFDILEINKAAGAFRMNGTDVTCAAYDWTAGAVDVLSGSFTTNDLLDNAITGAFYLNTGGTINLNNPGGWADLKGDLHIYGGTMNVSGTVSYWPYGGNASIEMSDGILDFSCGITIHNTASYTLTENITGGTIRTGSYFKGNRADFTPAGGTIELYGSSDYYITQSNGCTFHDININKFSKGANNLPLILTDPHSGEKVSGGGKANSIALNSDITVTNDLTITSGELKLNGHSLNVAHDCDVYGTFTMDNATDILNIGQSYSHSLTFNSGSTGNFSDGIANIYGWLKTMPGSSFTASSNNKVVFAGPNGGGPDPKEASTVYANVEINKNSGARTYISASATVPFVVNGTFTIFPDNEFEMQNNSMILHGNFVDNTTSKLFVYNAFKSAGPESGGYPSGGNKAKGGLLEMDLDFTLNGLMDLGTGTVTAHGLINQTSTGILTIDGGSYICDATTSGFNELNGTYNLSSGLLEFNGSSCKFFGTSNITGGTVRTNETLWANDGGFQADGGTLELNGNSNGYYIFFTANNYINDFLFNRTGNYIVYPQNSTDPLVIKGDVAINSGTFDQNGCTIYVGGNWSNNAGEAAFAEGGRVVFNGTSAYQYCSDESFDILEVNKVSGAFGINGTNVTCAAYDWTAGAVDVLSGSFTANDLLDNAIAGAFYLNSGGTINLNNPGGWVDLKGDLHIYGGTMNVNGSVSWWPYGNNASIEMSGGILDFSCGIKIYNTPTYTLTENISGGLIKTSSYFIGERADFTPTAGTFEFYGSSDYYISQANGSTLFDVNINKSSKGGNLNLIVTDPHSGEKVSGGGKANSITLNSDITVTNNLTITSGEVKLNGHTLNVAHNCITLGTLTMDNSADVLNVGTNTGDMLYFLGGSTGNITNGTINLAYSAWFDPGSSFTATTDNTLYFGNTLDFGGIYNASANTQIGNLIVDMAPGNKWVISAGSTYPVVVAGDFTTNQDNKVVISEQSLVINGTYHDYSSSEFYAYYTTKSGKNTLSDEPVNPTGQKSKGGSLEIYNDFTLHGLLDVGDGNVLIHGKYTGEGSCILTINGGLFINDLNNTSITNQLQGIYNISDGIMEFSNSDIAFYGTLNMDGGTIRVGSSITAFDNSFQPNGGTLELIGGNATSTILFYDNNYISNLTINKTSLVSVSPLTGTLTIKGDVLINSGSFNSWDNTIEVGGNWTNNVGNSGFYEYAGTVVFNGNGPSIITTDETFYNLTLDKTYGSFDGLELNNGITVNALNDLEISDGTMEMNSNSTLDVNGNVHIAADAGLNAYLDTGLKLYIGGNWTNDNTEHNTVKGYTPGTEDITFNGNTDQVLTTVAPREEFGNLIINKSAGQFKPNATLDITGDLLIVNGAWDDNVSGLTHYFEGDFQVNSTGGYHGTGTTTVFKGSLDQDITFNSSTYLTDMTIDKSDWTKKSFSGGEEGGTPAPKNKDANSVVRLLTDLNIQNGDLVIDEGIFRLNGHTFLSYGDSYVNSGGTLSLNAGSTLKIGQGKSLVINSGGTFEAIGTAANNARVTKFNYDAGFYTFSVENGGTISSEYTTYEYINGQSLFVKPGALVDPAKAFNYCTFKNSQPGAGSGMLGLFNDQALTCTGVTFEDSGAQFNVGMSGTGTNDVYMVDAQGDYAGPEYELDANGHLHWSDMDVELDLKVILAGPYNGTDMNTDLNTLGLIPLNQPFNSVTGADWYYNGTESVSSIPANVVDWVLVQIRDAIDATNAGSGTVVAEQAAFLLNDGSVVDLDGTSNLSFPGITYTSGLYPVVWHRNHLGVISANRMTKSGGVYTYDFTAAGSAYSNSNAGETDLGSGVYGLWGGDGNGSGWVWQNGEDISWWKTEAGMRDQYFDTDYNMNGQVDNTDKDDIWFPGNGMHSQIPGSKKSNNGIDK